jgi:hypothetical protein
VLQSSSLHMNVGPGWSSVVEVMDVADVDAADAMEEVLASHPEPLSDEVEDDVDTDVLRRLLRVVSSCVFAIENDEGSCTMNCLGVPGGRTFAFCCLNAEALLMIRD